MDGRTEIATSMDAEEIISADLERDGNRGDDVIEREEDDVSLSSSGIMANSEVYFILCLINFRSFLSQSCFVILTVCSVVSFFLD